MRTQIGEQFLKAELGKRRATAELQHDGSWNGNGCVFYRKAVRCSSSAQFVPAQPGVLRGHLYPVRLTVEGSGQRVTRESGRVVLFAQMRSHQMLQIPTIQFTQQLGRLRV